MFLDFPGYLFFYAISPLGHSWSQGLSVSSFTCQISASWLSVIFWHQMSMRCSSVLNTQTTQLNLILPTAVVGTFPMVNARFDLVYFINTVLSLFCQLEFLVLLMVRYDLFIWFYSSAKMSSIWFNIINESSKWQKKIR